LTTTCFYPTGQNIFVKFGDNNGKITQEFILHKLKNKSNWISEFSILKKAFPKNWIDILKTESSVKSIVNILPLLSIISFTKNIPLLIHSLNFFFFQM
jgi:hypothetical protein